MKILFFLIFIAGIGNTVLRPDMENPLTLYRIVAPLGLAAVFALRPMFVLRWLGLFSLFVVYNFVLAIRYSSDLSEFWPSIVHYLYLLVLLVLMMDMRLRYGDFERQFVKFSQGFCLFLLFNLFLEAIYGSYYPNLYENDSDDGSIRAFYWNQNDLAVVLCVMTWFALCLDKFRGVVRLAMVMITAGILYINDSKAALLSLVAVSLPVYAFSGLRTKSRLSGGIWFVILSGAAMLVIFGVLAESSTDIQFATSTYSLGDLLVKPITNILTLQSSGEALGSINNRTDAAIFVLIEYAKSYGFGLGAGGSWLVLTLPQYKLGGAMSPHNALLQFIVDFGYPVLLGYCWLVYSAIRRLLTKQLDEYERLKVMGILSFPLLGLSQSGAIVTNYYFWGAVSFIWLLGRDVPLARETPRPETLPSSDQRDHTVVVV